MGSSCYKEYLIFNENLRLQGVLQINTSFPKMSHRAWQFSQLDIKRKNAFILSGSIQCRKRQSGLFQTNVFHLQDITCTLHFQMKMDIHACKRYGEGNAVLIFNKGS